MTKEIKCIVTNTLDMFKFNIKIYDINNNLIKESYTCIYGVLDISYLKHGIYYIVISACSYVYPKILKRKIIIDDLLDDDFVFYFKYKNNSHLIKFTLKDKNYPLKIKEGEIYLWQENIR